METENWVDIYDNDSTSLEFVDGILDSRVA